MKSPIICLLLAILSATQVYAQNVGISTAKPLAKLDVNGAILTRNRLVISPQNGSDPAANRIWAMDNYNSNFRIFTQPNITTDGATFLTISPAGNVGIKTETPMAELDVNGLVITNLLKVGAAGTTTSGIQFGTYNFGSFESTNARFTITFPVAFPNNNYVVTMLPFLEVFGSDVTIRAFNKTPEGFSVIVTKTGAATINIATLKMDWIALAGL